jgi:hypothetical protein
VIKRFKGLVETLGPGDLTSFWGGKVRITRLITQVLIDGIRSLTWLTDYVDLIFATARTFLPPLKKPCGNELYVNRLAFYWGQASGAKKIMRPLAAALKFNPAADGTA